MAAFDNTMSRLTLQPLGRSSVIDIRYVRLPDERPPPGDYDPLEHRTPKNPIKLWMAYLNLLRIGFGAGVLGFPLAISQAGIILGPLLSFFSGVLIMYTHLVLLKCLNEISRQLKIPCMCYRYGFRIALLHGPPFLKWIGKRGPNIIATFMIMSQIGICTVFVDFTADSLRDIMDWESSKIALLCLLLPYLLLEYFMKSLKIVSYISMIGNIMNLVGLILIFYLIFKDPHGEVISATTETLPLLFAFGSFLFNLSAVGVILTLDMALTKPLLMIKKCGVVTIGMMVPTVIATVFGTLGYWSFGTMEENVLRSLPYDDDAAMAAIGLYMISVALSYPIQCYPGVKIILEVVKNLNPLDEPSVESMRTMEIVARPAFVISTFVIAYLLPFQGPFVALVGNLCTTLLSLVFPAMMELSLMYPGPYGKKNIYFIKNVIIIVIGIVSWIFGVVLSVHLIYVRILASSSPNDSEYFK